MRTDFLVARLDIDYAIGHEPGLREGRGEEVRPREAPQNLSPRAGRDTRRKERRGGAMDRAIAAARHLMQRAERQSASGEMPVELFNAEGQHSPPAASRALEAPDARAKLLDTGTGDGCAHGLGNGLGDMFHICSHLAQRINGESAVVCRPNRIVNDDWES